MPKAGPETVERFDELAEAFVARGAERSQMFGMPVLKAGGKVFAGTFGDAMTFKLAPDDLEKARKPSGSSRRPVKGRAMKEGGCPLPMRSVVDLAERAFSTLVPVTYVHPGSASRKTKSQHARWPLARKHVPWDRRRTTGEDTIRPSMMIAIISEPTVPRSGLERGSLGVVRHRQTKHSLLRFVARSPFDIVTVYDAMASTYFHLPTQVHEDERGASRWPRRSSQGFARDGTSSPSRPVR